jgi:SGNH domain (fused to AT3 domains)
MTLLVKACTAMVRSPWRHRGVTVTPVLRSSAAILAAAAVVLSACATSHAPAAPLGASTNSERPFATTAQVLEAVKAAQGINDLPDTVGFLTKVDWPMATGDFDCREVDPQDVSPPVNVLDPSRGSEFGQCAAGAEHGTKLMVTFGDSRAGMWGPALEDIAANNGYQLRTFQMGNCPPLDLHFFSYEKRAPDDQCYQFRQRAIATIRQLHPDLVIVTSFSTHMLADGSQPTAAQWQQGWASTLEELTQPGTRLAMFGDIPDWAKDDAHCLAGHVMAVQKCSVPRSQGTLSGNLGAEQAAASAAGALYVPTVSWVCADRCEPVIAGIRVYQDGYHFTASYARYLTGAVGEALQPALS